MTKSAGKKTALVPKLRFPEFRGKSEWKQSKLSKESSILKGKGIAKADIDPNGLQPCIRYGELYTCYGEIINAVVSRTNISADQLFICEANDVIIPSSGETKLDIAKASCVLLDDIALGSDLNVIRAQIHGPFLSYYMNGPKKSDIAKVAQGDTVVHLYPSQLEELEINFPQSSEQHKIADFLISLDELIGVESQKLEAMNAHKKALMQDLFPREGETVPRLRFSEFGDVPAWKMMTLGEAATFYNGRAYNQEELLDQGEYRVLRVGNFFTNKHWYYSDLELDETKYCSAGDLLYAWSASFGPRLWSGEKVIYHYHIWKIVENKGIDKNFLCLILDRETERVKAASANGLGLLHITKGAIENWACPFPKFDEQLKISSFLFSMNEWITAQSDKIDALKIHKKGLMQQLFLAMDEVQR